MAYERTPLMYDLPTPTNMAPAMADDDEIEMPFEYVGKGADPNVVSQPPPFSILEFLGFKPSTPPVVTVAAALPKSVPLPKPSTFGFLDKFSPATKVVAVVGAGALAYYLLKKKG